MVNKTISLSHEMWYKLKDEGNASGLIDRLLVQHYDRQDLARLSQEQRNQLIELVKQKNELERQYEEIKNGNG